MGRVIALCVLTGVVLCPPPLAQADEKKDLTVLPEGCRKVRPDLVFQLFKRTPQGNTWASR